MDGFLALYVFMLAAFTGYEIIGRVPVILHTPLMSGSNFVHGIVLVGAMAVLGQAQTPLAKAIGFPRGAAGRGQRRRRLRGHRAHARDVQVEQGGRQVTGALALLVKGSYFLAALLFILGIKRMASPVTARSGIRWAGAGMLLATLATVLLSRAPTAVRWHNLPLIVAALADRRRTGRGGRASAWR
jgi:NAD(P) transhydrogenase subunit alpha